MTFKPRARGDLEQGWGGGEDRLRLGSPREKACRWAGARAREIFLQKYRLENKQRRAREKACVCVRACARTGVCARQAANSPGCQAKNNSVRGEAPPSPFVTNRGHACCPGSLVAGGGQTAPTYSFCLKGERGQSWMPSFFSEYEGSHWVVTGHLHLYHPGPASCPRRMLSSAGRSLPGALWIFSSGFSFLVHFLADIQSYFQIPKLRLVLLVSPGSNAQQEPLAGSQLTTGHLPVAGGSCPQHQLGTGPGDHPALSCCFRAQGLPETVSEQAFLFPSFRLSLAPCQLHKVGASSFCIPQTLQRL